MYVLLSGTLPFPGESSNEIFKNVLMGKYKLGGAKWESISNEAKDLISKLIVKDPR